MRRRPTQDNEREPHADTWRPEGGPSDARFDAAQLDGERVESPPSVLQRWSGLPRGLRATVAAAVAIAITFAVVPFGLDRTRSWLTERALRDRVLIVAEIDASSSSSSPPGGRVDYYLSIRNDGPRRLRVTEVRLDQPDRLRAVIRDVGSELVQPGGSLLLPLSVALDCAAASPTGRGASMGVQILVVPASGRRHHVDAAVPRAGPLGAVADTLCAVTPGVRVKELSGPVLVR